MTEYTVRWMIEVDADDPVAAAREARDAQTNPDTTATVFDVRPYDGEPFTELAQDADESGSPLYVDVRDEGDEWIRVDLDEREVPLEDVNRGTGWRNEAE